MAHASCAFLGIQHGTGQHAWEIQPPTEIPVGLKVGDLILLMCRADMI